MNNIELSFCIPTYNRAQIVYRLITNILSSSDPAIEVVVLDNGSTDDTLSVLQAIKDTRLCVYSNGENKGALFNMVNVLNKGRGKFLVYSTDQDHIDSTKIDRFKTFLLQNSDLAGGYCAFNSELTIDYEIFQKGHLAIKKIAYQGRHPTGYFFNNDLLKPIKLVERFSDYDFVGLFPLEFVFAELCSIGDGAIYHRPIFTPETGTMVVKHKSSTTNGKSKLAFFSPEARFKQAVNYAKHINTLKLTLQEKNKLIIDTFVNELTSATKGYQAVMMNENLCTHYYMDPKKIKNRELLSIGLNFYMRYKREAMSQWGGGGITKINFELHVLMILFSRVIRRSIRNG
jgi:glycosyltransferase involved in cell wall biosynthesis